jgi:glycosyltransferase involved in cell wall biosynthesis
MFWGRLAARRAGVPVIVSALHTTGWPDCIGRLNRWLTPLNDAFVSVARSHGQFLVQGERFPADKVHVIPNGVDTDRFAPGERRAALMNELGLPFNAPVAGIVARLDKVKNHGSFLRVAAAVRRHVPQAHFLIVGDGPQRSQLESLAADLRVQEGVHFVGNRADVPALLRLMDVFLLTSHNEANPVSILESLASGVPVIATRVGSIPETVLDGVTGYSIEPGDEAQLAERVCDLFRLPERARQMGAAGRNHVVKHWSLEQMVSRYETLIASLYSRKLKRAASVSRQA